MRNTAWELRISDSSPDVCYSDVLPERRTADPMPLPAREQHDSAEALIAATGADFRIGGARAFYDVGGDYLHVPPQPAFTHQIDFYRTALHELGHWPGS